jgi:hypothetical protein
MSTEGPKRTFGHSFDQLVGAPISVFGTVMPSALAVLRFDDQFKLGCLHDRQFGT